MKKRAYLCAIPPFLEALLLPQIFKEVWKRHTSGYSQTWRVAIESKNKVNNLDSVNTGELARAIAESNMDLADRMRVEKDAHIINAALSSDRVIVTYDEHSLRTMEKYCPLASVSTRIKWVNPAKDGLSIFEEI